MAYALPTWEHRTAASASSSSPNDDELLGTPSARMWKGAGPVDGPTHHRNSARGLIEAQVLDLLPTPSANIGSNGGSQHPDKRRAGNHQPSIQDVAEHVLMPTPRATRGGSGTETMYRLGAKRSDDNRPQGEVLLQTPAVADGMGSRKARGGERSNEKLLPGQAVEMATDWGPYGPAIHRWERVLGRPAPAPTELNSKGGHRLSPRFTEWMMGVPAGWICDTDISRNDQLKAAGNGVVPQQAAAALKDMLATFGVETGEAAA